MWWRWERCSVSWTRQPLESQRRRQPLNHQRLLKQHLRHRPRLHDPHPRHPLQPLHPLHPLHPLLMRYELHRARADSPPRKV